MWHDQTEDNVLCMRMHQYNLPIFNKFQLKALVLTSSVV